MRTSVPNHKENSTILWVIIFILASIINWAPIGLNHSNNKNMDKANALSQETTSTFLQ